MANFNLGLADKNDPSYMKDAKDVSVIVPEGMGNFVAKQSAINKEAADRLSNDKLESFNSLLKGGIKSTTDTIKEFAFNEIQNGVDERRNAQGVDLGVATADATDAQTNGPMSNNKPPNASEIENQFKRFQAAKDQGKLTDTNYYGQLESLVRSVKSRYPGFERDIDQMIHRTTGITPANALRESIQRDMDAAATASKNDKSKEETFVRQNLKWLSENDLNRYNNGDMPFAEIEEKVRRSESKSAVIDQTKAELTLKAEQKKLTDADVVSGARTVAANVQSHISDNFLVLANKAQEQLDKGAYDPKQFLAAMPQFRAQALNSLQSQLNSKEFVNMPKEDRAAIIKEANDLLDGYEKSFTNPETGLLNYHKNLAQARIDSTTNKLLDANPLNESVAALQKISPLAVQAVLADPSAGKGITETLTQVTQNKIVPGSTPFLPANGANLPAGTKVALNNTTANGANLPAGTKVALNNTTANAVLPDQVTPQQQLDYLGGFPKGRSTATTNFFINNWQNILTNPKLPPEALKTAAEKMFNKGNLNFILDNFKNDGSQANAYLKLTSPAVTKQMEKLKGTEVWNNYTFWAKNNFANVYRDQVQALEKVAEHPYIDVVFDPSTGRFGVKPSAEGIRVANSKKPTMAGWSTMETIERLISDDTTSKIEALNKSIDTIRPVLQGDNYDVAKEIKALTMHFGEHSNIKSQGVWSLLLKSMGPSDKQAAPDTEFGGTHPNFTQASGGKGSSGGKLSTENDITEQLKASFSGGESNNDYNRLVDTPTHPKRIPLTNMTIGEVLDFQKGMLRAGNPSSAAGKYQIVSKTLRSLVREGVVKMDDKYDENTQERLADALLERRGLNDFMAGKLPARQFLGRLGDEWQIIKKSPAYAKKVISALEDEK